MEGTEAIAQGKEDGRAAFDIHAFTQEQFKKSSCKSTSEYIGYGHNGIGVKGQQIEECKRTVFVHGIYQRCVLAKRYLVAVEHSSTIKEMTQ